MIPFDFDLQELLVQKLFEAICIENGLDSQPIFPS